ncbi:MAG: DUF559 domain-containing protein [Candidatus Marinimicrobia bacterium]|nr:DUF559 domain-containing protein [Candidatus Neomarinimicrobiota bacterium]
MTKTRQAFRRIMPKAEIILWSYLKGRQLQGLKFRRQYSIDKYTVDFYCPEIRMAIKVDGESHLYEKQKVKDLQKEKELEISGIKLVRYLNTDIYDNIEGVIEDLYKQVEE